MDSVHLLCIHLIIVTLLCLCKYSDQQSLISTNPMLVDRLLPKGYDPLMPPKLNGKPVNVEVKVSVLNIRSIKETELSYTVDIFYHQYWSDYRILPQNLSHDQRIVLDNKWRDKLWIPDSYFKNALSGHVTNIIFPTLYFAVHNQTEIFMASRVTLQLSCDMNFAKFPHDTQECSIDIMSLSHNIKTVVLTWKEFYVTKTLHLKVFMSESDHQIEETTRSICSQEIYTEHFDRCYVFCRFWIPVTAYPARVALVITALLALITQQHQSAEVNVSYVIALNVWMIICITFVFFGLIEYAIAIAYFESRQQLKEDNNKGNKVSPNSKNLNNANNIEVKDCEQVENELKSNMSFRKVKWFQHLMNSSKRKIRFPSILDSNLNCVPVNTIDIISRYLFPFTFVICIIIYLFYIYLL